MRGWTGTTPRSWRSRAWGPYLAALQTSVGHRCQDTAALDARYFPINSFTEGGPIYNLIQDQFTPRRIRSLVPRAPVSLLPILGNGSALELDMDCWSKSESDWRYVLTATFNGLGTQVTALDGRVAALEASPLPADIFCTSLTASSFVETPELQGTPIVLRAIDNTPLLGPRCWSRTPPASS